jgi:hypothetical protein
VTTASANQQQTWVESRTSPAPSGRWKEVAVANLSERSNLSIGLILGTASFVLLLVGSTVAYLISGARESGANAVAIQHLSEDLRNLRSDVSLLRSEIRAELVTLREQVATFKVANNGK